MQAEIWTRVLTGDAWKVDIGDIFDRIESEMEITERIMRLPLHDKVTKFWKLWLVNVWGPRTKKALVPRYYDAFCPRIINIVIAFLGQYSEFGLDHGSRWNRGWRYREVE